MLFTWGVWGGWCGAWGLCLDWDPLIGGKRASRDPTLEDCSKRLEQPEVERWTQRPQQVTLPHLALICSREHVIYSSSLSSNQEVLNARYALIVMSSTVPLHKDACSSLVKCFRGPTAIAKVVAGQDMCVWGVIAEDVTCIIQWYFL